MPHGCIARGGDIWVPPHVSENLTELFCRGNDRRTVLLPQRLVEGLDVGEYGGLEGPKSVSDVELGSESGDASSASDAPGERSEGSAVNSRVIETPSDWTSTAIADVLEEGITVVLEVFSRQCAPPRGTCRDRPFFGSLYKRGDGGSAIGS